MNKLTPSDVRNLKIQANSLVYALEQNKAKDLERSLRNIVNIHNKVEEKVNQVKEDFAKKTNTKRSYAVPMHSTINDAYLLEQLESPPKPPQKPPKPTKKNGGKRKTKKARRTKKCKKHFSFF